MASLLAARRQHLAAAGGLHARTEPMRFGAAASTRLKCALWQSKIPLWRCGRGLPDCGASLLRAGSRRQAAPGTGLEFPSVSERVAQGQEKPGAAHKAEIQARSRRRKPARYIERRPRTRLGETKRRYGTAKSTSPPALSRGRLATETFGTVWGYDRQVLSRREDPTWRH